jgi:hypothetical protein
MAMLVAIFYALNSCPAVTAAEFWFLVTGTPINNGVFLDCFPVCGRKHPLADSAN